MLNPPQLARAVTGCRGRAVAARTPAYRASHLKYYSHFPTAAPLYAGTPAGGSRYVPPGGPAVLYASFDPDTPHWELNQVFQGALATPAGRALADAGKTRPDPLAAIGIHLTLARLLDLHDSATRGALGIMSDAELLLPWKGAAAPTATQVLGQVVFDDGFFEGVMYPSAQLAGRKNLVLFVERLQPGSRVHFRGFNPPPLADAELKARPAAPGATP